MRRPVVGVMGGGAASQDTKQCAHRLGEAIAEAGWVLLNGGRDAGVMRASAEGARQAGGTVVGILPSSGAGDPRADVAEGVDVAVFTGLGEARNNVNVLTSDALVLLPGGSGTLSEAALAAKNRTPFALWDWPDEDVPPAIAEAAARCPSLEDVLAWLEENVPES